MSQFTPNEKVWVEATYDSKLKDDCSLVLTLNNQLVLVHNSSIHRAPTEELERLRAYVELMPCMCQRGLVKLCDRCKALGKEKS